MSHGGWRYLDYHPLILLVDGERMDLGDPARRGTIGDGYVLEQFRISRR